MTTDGWKSLIEHVQIHFEDHNWSNDGLYDKLVDESDGSDQSDSSDDE